MIAAVQSTIAEAQTPFFTFTKSWYTDPNADPFYYTDATGRNSWVRNVKLTVIRQDVLSRLNVKVEYDYHNYNWSGSKDPWDSGQLYISLLDSHKNRLFFLLPQNENRYLVLVNGGFGSLIAVLDRTHCTYPPKDPDHYNYEASAGGLTGIPVDATFDSDHNAGDTPGPC
jgi:hypothetical protein